MRRLVPPPDPTTMSPLSTALRAAALLLVATTSLQAQSGLVRGSVSDDAGRPLAAVRVIVVGATLATESRADGSFELRAVPVGARSVRAQRIGYRAGTLSVEVSASNAAVARFVLGSDP